MPVNHRVPLITPYTGLQFDACIDGKVNISENGLILCSIPSVGCGANLKEYLESWKHTFGTESAKLLCITMSKVNCS